MVSLFLQLHFSPDQWNRKTSRLLPGTVPLPKALQGCICNGKVVNFTIRSPNSIKHDHPYFDSKVNPNCEIHRRRSPSNKNNEFHAIVKENCDLKKKLCQLNAIAQSDGKENTGKIQRRPKEYTPDQIKQGLQLRFACGSTGYRKLKELQPSSPLPCVRTLQNATEHIKLAPGILEEVLEPLRVKFSGFSDIRDRDVNIVFDELVIKRRVDYDASLKRFIGYGTLPGQEKVLAEKGEIYVFRGIHQRLKQIVCYHLNPKEIQVDSKKEVILELLKKARDMGINVISLVCDMGNRGLLAALGFSTQKNTLKWRIQNPVKPDAKLWCVPDPVHVFKSLKESLCNNKFMELPPRIVVEFGLPSAMVDLEHIEWLDKFQRDDSIQLVPGLTFKDYHSTHFSKMKVKSVRKLVNPRTAAALQYLVVKGIVPEAFETTAWFLKLMNRWFQLMSSRNLQCALGFRNKQAYNEAIEHLKLVIFVFKYMVIPGGWKAVQSHIIFATSSILEIQDYLLNERNYEFVQTGAFTADVVENINSSIRISCPNPSALEFKNRLRQLTIAQFQMKITSSSYDFDGSEDFVDILLNSKKVSQQNAQIIQIDFSHLKWNKTVPQDAFKPHEEDVLYRICGYIIVSLKKKKILSCEDCLQRLRHCGETPHPHSIFLQLTDFVPGAQFSVIDNVFQMFRLIEYNLKLWAPKIQQTESLDCVIDSLVLPGVVHISLPTCHNVRRCLCKAFTVMRYKQIAVSQFSPLESNTSSSLASKTAGGHYLTQCFRQSKSQVDSSVNTPKRNKQKKNSSGGTFMERLIALP
jgi:hypothetical protein